ncbi:uncharacterized protein N7483_008204 [Penicillium malachiteum]|uniref:uncharacterized protein n=1 Tax=Penicillium malachiteum TaxID=1324776 RepID=UPI002548AF25|nr:uncharacterized protein N7483_008204 [Penicillium malachiteum]KAJ5720270.1 hypothetical protein N7483_008204 [Penicillium malachiteum]
MWEYYRGKSIFLTGGTGTLGTAILCRLLNQAAPKRVFILCRGGLENAYAKWQKLLPDAMATALSQSSCVTFLSGDITLKQMGLHESDWRTLKKSVQVIIHAASSISLTCPLPKLATSIIAPSLSLAEIAMEFADLQHFVYISTAYVNAHLWKTTDRCDVPVKECIYSLGPYQEIYDPHNLDEWAGFGPQTEHEWRSVLDTGTSIEFDYNDFPWPYAYAKHLTERLLINTFMQNEATEKLLIVRPSCLGPATSQPYPGYSSLSTSSTGLAASIMLYAGNTMKLPTRSADPENEVTMDEIPVDVVVDRILSHTAKGTFGCVHAVAGKRARLAFNDWWPAVMKERRLPWLVKPEWLPLDWHSPKLHSVAKFYVILGTSFAFEDDQVSRLLAKLNAHEKLHLKLFVDETGETNPYDLKPRRHRIRQMGMKIARKRHLPGCFVKLCCRSGTLSNQALAQKAQSSMHDYGSTLGLGVVSKETEGEMVRVK